MASVIDLVAMNTFLDLFGQISTPVLEQIQCVESHMLCKDYPFR